MTTTAPHRSGDSLHDGGVVIIGGGLGGLAAAIELAGKDVPVTIVEANTHLGGMVGSLEADGFAFDTGPTTITMPHVLEGIIERAGRDPSDYLDLVNLDPQWRCFFDDGSRIDLPRDPHQFAREIDARFPDTKPGQGFLKFYQFSHRMHGLSEQASFNINRDTIIKNAAALRLYSTAGATIEKMIPEPHIRRVCQHFLHSTGSDPFKVPAALNRLASAQLDQGFWYPKGGTRMIARALARIAIELGVQRVMGRRVTKILTEHDRATGVKLDDGREITAAAVSSNCDVFRTYHDLLKGVDGAALEHRRIASAYTLSCSAFVLYLGLRRQYDHLAHHNIFFSRDNRQESDDIDRKCIPASDPTLHVTAPSRTDNSRAPDGCEALHIFIQVPAMTDKHEWLQRGGKPGKTLTDYRAVVIDQLKRHGMDDIQDHIAVERFLTPPQIEYTYNTTGGAIYGLASHGRLKGLTKPGHRSKVLPNLYFAGGSVGPGASVPMVLTGGVMAARSMCDDFGIGDNVNDT